MPKIKFDIYKLHFSSGFHFNSAGYAYESSDWMIHSDTLFGAICHAYKLLYGNTALEIFLDDGNPSLRLSSCFPFQGREYFFPVPLKDRNYRKVPDYELEKKMRKATLLPFALFQKDLFNQLDEIEWADYLKQHQRARLYREIERPRVTVDRINSQGQIFHFAEIHYPENAGLFFLAEFDDRTVAAKVEAALRLLGDEGIGGDSTIGKGQFRLEKAEMEMDLPDAGAKSIKHLLLSLYNPDPSEIPNLDPQASRFDYAIRNGWSSAGNMTLRRQTIRMLKEGSVIAGSRQSTPKGRVAVVLADQFGLGYPIYRYGKAFSLPILSSN